jgi:L-amino acid N-acyltransferase YncA
MGDTLCGCSQLPDAVELSPSQAQLGWVSGSSIGSLQAHDHVVAASHYNCWLCQQR